ncbi:MAG: DNA-3-methyladenine glycosylase [Candidatus Pacebacteria bacterium]|nr:DNA-3-methyladenine glycosylase [Candidatus Paceibacterota bacterium]
MKILKKTFYSQPTEKVAKELLGKFLCRKINNRLYVGKIVETEAYLGKKDLACHTSKGMTERNKIMFGPAGHAYIYFIYGMYHCFNVVTEKENDPCAVLIRALEPIETYTVEIRHCLVPTKLLNGPAKLCREFEIDKKLNGHDLTLGKKLWIENGKKIRSNQIKKSKRVGVDYAGIWKDRLLRFYIKDNEFVSKR